MTPRPFSLTAQALKKSVTGITVYDTEALSISQLSKSKLIKKDLSTGKPVYYITIAGKKALADLLQKEKVKQTLKIW